MAQAQYPSPQAPAGAGATEETGGSLSLSAPSWLKDWGVFLWIGYLLVILAFAVIGARVAPYDPTGQLVTARLQPLFAGSSRGVHWLGTDQLGRDVLSNIIVAARLTLFIGIVSTFIGMVIGVALGTVAGFYGGKIDRLVAQLTEAQTAMPMFLVAIFFLSIMGPSIVNVLIILPTLVWPVFARVVRAETLRIRSAPFVEAAVASGCTDAAILGLHILPNLVPRIAVLAVIEIGHVMLAEAGLSFLGVGVQPPETTWGLLIARGRAYLAVAWWLAIMPGVFLGLTVLALNMLARRVAGASGTAA